MYSSMCVCVESHGVMQLDREKGRSKGRVPSQRAWGGRGGRCSGLEVDWAWGGLGATRLPGADEESNTRRKEGHAHAGQRRVGWRGRDSIYSWNATITTKTVTTTSGISIPLTHILKHTAAKMSAAAGPSNPSASSSSIAQKTFELNNDMITLDPHKDAIFHFDNEQQKQALNAAPWKKE